MIFLIVYIIISSIGFGMSIEQHGKERKPENAWNAFAAFIIGLVLVLGIYLTAN